MVKNKGERLNGLLSLFILLVLYSSVAVAHTPSYHSENVLDVERITVEQGLSHNTVIFIFQDSLGCLWFGTGYGVNRYDGYRYENYRHDEREFAYSSWIKTMAQDRSGNYWLGTTAGLTRMDKKTGKFVFYRHNPGDPGTICSNDINTIYANVHAGIDMIWVGTGSGLSRIIIPGTPGGKLKIKNYYHDPSDDSSVAGNHINVLLESRRQGVTSLWIGTRTGLSQLILKETPPANHKEKFVNYTSHAGGSTTLSGNIITSICEIPSAKGKSPDLFVGTTAGLNRLRWDEQGEMHIKYYRNEPANPRSLSLNHVTAVTADTLNQTEPRLWIGTRGGGLNVFDLQAETFKNYTNDPADANSLSDSNILALHLDHSGILWAGTQYGGLNKIIYGEKKLKFAWYDLQGNDNSTLSNCNVRCIVEDPGSRDILWIGTYEGGIKRFDRKTGSMTHFTHDPADPGSISDNRVYCLRLDRGGTLYAGTLRGIDQLKPDGTFTHFKLVTGQGFRAMYLDRSGSLWLGTSGVGLYRLDADSGTVKAFRHDPGDPNSLSCDDIYSLTGTFEKDSEILWIGTVKAGLSKFDIEEESFTHYRHDPAAPHTISSNFVLCVCPCSVDPETLWIGTYRGGLNKFNVREERFSHFKGMAELLDDVVYGILPDERYNLWLSTNMGITKFNIPGQTFRNYNAADGLGGNEFNGGAYYKNEKGELFFGGTHGLNVFHPDKVFRNPHIPQMVLTVLKDFREVTTVGGSDEIETIELTREHQVVSFEFAALDFLNPKKNKYKYKLEGLDKGWVDGGNRRVVNYTHLNPGSYVFKVQGSNSDNVWNEEGISVKLKVIPSIRQTSWFKFLLVMVSVLFLLFLYRVWLMSKQKKILQVMVADRTKGFKQASEKAREMALEAKKANEAKSWFLANMSHEIRTPMAGIIGLSSLLLDSKLSPEQQQQLAMVNQSANHLLGVLNDILDFSKIEAGQLQLSLEEFDIFSTMAEISHIVAQQVEEKGLEFEWLPYDNIPDRVFGDPQRLKQVLLNLIGNAVKFTEKGKIRVDVRVGNEAEKVKDSDNIILYFSVADTGTGIPPEQQAHIFNSFTQADNTISRKHGGTGLGLAISRQLVELMGGKIWVESNPRGGSIFHFTVQFSAPAARQGSEAAPANEIKSSAEENETGERSRLIDALSRFKDNVRLLLAEDNPINQKLARSLIEKTGIPVDIVGDGFAVLATVKEKKYRLILMDIQMPGLDGFAAAERIRRDLELKDVPIIAMTAHAMKEDKEKCFAVGMNDYITKPFKPNEFYRVLLKWL